LRYFFQVVQTQTTTAYCRILTYFSLRLEFDNNGGSDDEQLKDELLRIFDRERLGLESYFKQKTENILAGYRRKQYDWEEKVRLERMEYEKTLAQEKTEVCTFVQILIGISHCDYTVWILQ
jgi:hypothetical protein